MTNAPHSILEQAGLASGLLSQEQIDQAWHVLVHSSTVANRSLDEVTDQLLGDHLVELGYINRWQAEQLRLGRTKFTLGPYRIVDTLGQGGMGYVFKGEHVLLGRVEAIKVLPRRQTDAASIAAFEHEIRSQAQLDHPNLVRLSFADKEGDTYFLVTEFVPGADLRRMLRHHGSLNANQAAIVISQIAEALAYIHQRGLVHRDVKPGNVLVTPEGTAKLTDLGLARFSSEIDGVGAESSTHIVGTPDYVSPESIISPTEVKFSSDIYSLGCTLYYAVTGKVPFPGGNTGSKLRRHVDEAPITPIQFNDELDDEFVATIGEMIHKDPALRTGSAAEVVERLRPWAEKNAGQIRIELGEIAQRPAERAIPGGMLASTRAIDADVSRTQPARSGPPPVKSQPHTPTIAMEQTKRIATDEDEFLVVENTGLPRQASRNRFVLLVVAAALGLVALATIVALAIQ